jgi:hypothetical protein
MQLYQSSLSHSALFHFSRLARQLNVICKIQHLMQLLNQARLNTKRCPLTHRDNRPPYRMPLLHEHFLLQNHQLVTPFLRFSFALFESEIMLLRDRQYWLSSATNSPERFSVPTIEQYFLLFGLCDGR